MLAKSLLAGVVLSVMAGGVVYFGMGEGLTDQTLTSQADGASMDSAGVQPSSKEKLKDLLGRKPVKDDKADSGEPEAEIASIDRAEDMAKEEMAKEGEVKQPRKRWLDEYLKTDKADDAEDSDNDLEVEPELEIEIEPELEPEPEPEPEPKTTKTITTKTVTTTTETPDELEEAAAELMKPKATGSYVVKEDEDNIFIEAMGDDLTFDLLITETEKLDIPDMRDQAYLNIVDYALFRGDRERAETVLQKLSREELRDTARGRVAVALAKSGQAEDAFAMVEGLEIDELQDPIRLQVIEALTIANIPFANIPAPSHPRGKK